MGNTLKNASNQSLTKYIMWPEGPSGDFAKMASTDPS
jgi:hypothetical protein